MLVKDEGIVAHRMRYSETSWIVSWLTRSHGVVKTVVKGGARPRQSFAGRLDLFYECRMAYRRSKSTHLHTLTEAEALQPNAHLRRCYLKTLCATYFFELIAKLAEPDADIGDLYEVFHRALAYLKNSKVSDQLVARYERRVMKIMGLGDGSTSAHTLFEHAGIPKSYELLKKEFSRKRIRAAELRA